MARIFQRERLPGLGLLVVAIALLVVWRASGSPVAAILGVLVAAVGVHKTGDPELSRLLVASGARGKGHRLAADACVVAALVVLYLVFVGFGPHDPSATGLFQWYNTRSGKSVGSPERLPLDLQVAQLHAVISFTAFPLLLVAAGLIRGAERGNYFMAKAGAGIAAGCTPAVLLLSEAYKSGIAFALDPRVTVFLPALVIGAGILAYRRENREKT